MESKLLCSRFQLQEQIGAGSFGVVYSATDLTTRERVAIKVENPNLPLSQILNESNVYSILSGGQNIPNCHFCGKHRNQHVLALDLLGPSLECLFSQNGRRFSLKTVLMLADQILASIQYVHDRHFLHRDIKPGNFVIGTGNRSNQLFLIDFGLAKKFEDPATLEHIRYCEYSCLTGTARYASVHALRGIETSRRDDLESFAYILIYFLRGKLPWIGLRGSGREKEAAIMTMKEKITVEELCAGLPKELSNFVRSVKHLRFRERPPYEEYRELFQSLFVNSGFVMDYKFDWTEAKPRKTPRIKGEVPVVIHKPRLVPAGVFATNIRRNGPGMVGPNGRRLSSKTTRRGVRRAILGGTEQIARLYAICC
jgi:serine/threonine protein kinase